MQTNLTGFSFELEEAEYQRVAVFSLLRRRQNHVARFDLDEGLRSGKHALVGLGGDRNQWEVELEAAPLSFRGFPVAGVRIEGIGKFVEAFVGVWVRPGGRAQQREADDVSLGIVTILARIQQAKPVT